jgi:hypothetical protein
MVELLAVPQTAAAEFKTDADLLAALKAGKVKGVSRLEFDTDTATVPKKVKGDKVTWTYTITAIDDKEIKATIEGEGYKPPKDEKEPKNEEDEEGEPEPLTAAPRGNTAVAGVAAALAVTLGGLWVAGRARRKP